MIHNREYNPIRTPLDNNWLRRVPEDAPIFLVKENKVAEIEWAFDPQRYGTGRIGLKIYRNNAPPWRETWFIRPDGKGIDGSQCLLPCEGFLKEDEVELPPKYLNDLTRRVERLEQMLDSDMLNEIIRNEHIKGIVETSGRWRDALQARRAWPTGDDSLKDPVHEPSEAISSDGDEIQEESDQETPDIVLRINKLLS
jgi:hypothetical protein